MQAGTAGADTRPTRKAMTMVMECGPEDIGRARRRARLEMKRWNIDQSVQDDAVLVISELMTNAVRHAVPPVVLRVISCPERNVLRIEVTDCGPKAHPPCVEDGTEEHGRGLRIVAACSEHCGTTTHIESVTRWADLTLEAVLRAGS